ncbi:MAG: hypothetical protein ACRENI_09785 [Gemmatimonadaceae bacterium]
MNRPPDTSDDVFAELLRNVDALLVAPRGVDEPRRYTDVVSDLLAFLAREMTSLNELRQAEVRRFLGWLENETGCPIDALSGKTRVLEYHDQAGGADALLEVLERNYPGRISLDVRRSRRYGARNAHRERIVEGYASSMHVLDPLMQKIVLTDRLIDQLVYRLHDLTPDEIALVESTVGEGSAAPSGLES